MYTTITLKQLLDILPLQTANGIKKGDLSTVICLEDIVENLPLTDKTDFVNNNVETILTYGDDSVFGAALDRLGYVNPSTIDMESLIDGYDSDEIMSKIPMTDINEYVGMYSDDDDLIEILEGRGYVINEQ